jgi:hypothetical protein
MNALTPEESAQRVRRLRKLGYQVKRVATPMGVVVLVSKKRFVCRGHHCVWKREPPPPTPKSRDPRYRNWKDGDPPIPRRKSPKRKR